jgi:hypothetical protein
LLVTAFFEGDCHHFGIAYTNALDAEVKYSRHFDREFRRRNCLGIEVMLDLHTNATEQCFVEARRRFDAQLFRESLPRPLPHSPPFCILHSSFCIHLRPSAPRPRPCPQRLPRHFRPARHRPARRFGLVRREIMARCVQTR